MQVHDHDCPGVALHTLVVGSCGHVVSNTSLPASSSQPSNTPDQSGPTQKPGESQPSCMAPRASAIKEQGFSGEVANWTIFTKWCHSHKVDFRAPSLKDVADFLLYLFQEKNFQPSTIDGHRSAISDKLGPVPVLIGKDENLMHLLESFHMDRPKEVASPPGTCLWCCTN